MKKKLFLQSIVFFSIFLFFILFIQAESPKKSKIYISVDMEGIGGVVTQAQTSSGQFEYEKGRKLMTAEVNAAIEGCLEAGAGEIVVADSHGNAQSIIIDELNEAAELIRAFPRPLMQMEGINSEFDGVIFIGYHAKEGTPQSDLSHTFWGSKIFELKLNGISVSEAIFNAAIAGEYGVPVIFIAGDQNVVNHTKSYLGKIESVITKQSIGWLTAKSKHPSLICKEIKEKCVEAVKRIKEFKAYKLNHPIKMELTFKHTYDAEAFSYLPMVTRVDGHTIQFTGKDMIEVGRFIAALFAINTR
ncbi:MAG: M55 family metallopeptidase [Candidatus Aminicenantia bacterium]